MTSTLPPAPPEDDDRERKWIIEGLRQALARATVDELARLTALLEPEADGAGNVAGWLVMLIADQTGRDRPGDEAPGNGQPTGGGGRPAEESGNGQPAGDGDGQPTRLSAADGPPGVRRAEQPLAPEASIPCPGRPDSIA